MWIQIWNENYYCKLQVTLPPHHADSVNLGTKPAIPRYFCWIRNVLTKLMKDLEQIPVEYIAFPTKYLFNLWCLISFEIYHNPYYILEH